MAERAVARRPASSTTLRSAAWTTKSRPSSSLRASASACHMKARRAPCGTLRDRISGTSASSSRMLSASSSSAMHRPRISGSARAAPAEFGGDPLEGMRRGHRLAVAQEIEGQVLGRRIDDGAAVDLAFGVVFVAARQGGDAQAEHLVERRRAAARRAAPGSCWPSPHGPGCRPGRRPRRPGRSPASCLRRWPSRPSGCRARPRRPSTGSAAASAPASRLATAIAGGQRRGNQFGQQAIAPQGSAQGLQLGSAATGASKACQATALAAASAGHPTARADAPACGRTPRQCGARSAGGRSG